MAQQPQSLIDALADPGFYPERPARVEHLATHISHVFLAGPYAYKLKKPVTFPFLNFSTLEKRRHFCHEEVRLNRRLCPDVYLGVVPITRADDGGLRLGGPGQVVDYVVRMRRLPDSGMLGRRIRENRLPAERLDELARTLAAFHDRAPCGPEVSRYGAPEALATRWQANMDVARDAVGELLAIEDFEILADFGPRFLDDNQNALHRRQAEGRIRDGHGDLHCDNVCMLEQPDEATGAPRLAPGIYVFDCIEFSDALRCNDVASEIAFLSMDLESLGRPDLAERFVAIYTASANDPEIFSLLPFYACYRACVRAKVGTLMLAQARNRGETDEEAMGRARRHYALAVRYAWRALGPTLIVCSGLSGTGKSTLAETLSRATGFEHVSTDALRRAAAPGTSIERNAALYTPARRAATYRKLCQRVDDLLAARNGVIADATFIDSANRRDIAAVAMRHRCPHVFLESQAEESTIRARLEARNDTTSDSDARWATYCAQRQERHPFAAHEPHIVVATDGSSAATRTAAMRALWAWRQGAGDGRDAALRRPHNEVRGSA